MLNFHCEISSVLSRHLFNETKGREDNSCTMNKKAVAYSGFDTCRHWDCTSQPGWWLIELSVTLIKWVLSESQSRRGGFCFWAWEPHLQGPCHLWITSSSEQRNWYLLISHHKSSSANYKSQPCSWWPDADNQLR